MDFILISQNHTGRSSTIGLTFLLGKHGPELGSCVTGVPPTTPTTSHAHSSLPQTPPNSATGLCVIMLAGFCVDVFLLLFCLF